MRFKLPIRAIGAALVCVLGFFISSCSIRLYEEPASSGGAQGFSTLCLNGLQDLIGRYFEGKASHQEVEMSWNCSIDALTKFQTQTRGSAVGVWKPTELREFLHRFFISDFQISDRLLDEAMILKNSVIGGGTAEIRSGDLDQLIGILNILKEETLRLRPFMPIPLNDVSRRSDAEIVALEKALILSANRLGDALDAKWNPYPFSNLKAFAEELAKIYRDQGFEALSDRMELLVSLKRLLVSPIKVVRADGTLTEGLQGTELVRLFTTLSRSLGLYLRYQKLNSSLSGTGNMWTGEGLTRTVQLVRDGTGILLDALREYPFEVIPFSEIQALLKGLRDNEMGPFRRVTLEGTVEPFIRRFLGGPDFGLGGRRASGLSASGLRRTKAVIETWYDVQSEIEKGFVSVLGKSLPTQVLMGTPVAPMELAQYYSQVNMSSSAAEAAITIGQYLSSDKSFPTLFISDIPEITFFPYKSERRKTLYQMTMWNLFRHISTFLIEGWADEPGRAARTEKMSYAEFGNLVHDATPALIDLKFLDPAIDVDGLASKRFREANLFTPSGNGDEYLDFHEGMQYMALLMSGVNLAERIYGDLQSKCGLPELDVYGRHWLKEDCVRTNLFDPTQFEFYTQRMGLGPSYYLQLSADRAAVFRRALEASGRQDDGVGGRMNSYIGEGTATTLQYVEVMFSNFDRNRDGFIDETEEEGGQAYRVFERTLKSFATELSSDKQVRSLFSYLLKNGRIPRTNDCGKTTLGGKADFVRWHLRGNKDFRADRVRILEVFEEIARQVNKDSQQQSAKCAK